MKQIKITGGNTLTGEIKISGAKNSAVALIPTAILCDETATIFNVPNISDIDALSEILEYLNAGVKRIDKTQMKDIPKGGVTAEEAMKATDNYATGAHFTCE